MALNKVIAMDSIIKKGDGITFKFKEFQKEKDNNVQFCSPTFYCLDGYHMQVEVDANGDQNGKSTHVSVYIWILEGKHDADLRWPFIGNFTVEMLNQLQDRNHHEKIMH